MSTSALRLEFLDFRGSDDLLWAVRQLRQRGVADDAIIAADGARTALAKTVGTMWLPSEDGRPLVVLQVFMGMRIDDDAEEAEPLICDLVAFDPAKPGEWFMRRNEYGMALGGDKLAACGASYFHEPEVRLYETPLSWLLAGCDGACLLSGRECRSLLVGIPRVICETVELAERVDSMLKNGEPDWPRIMVAA